jgi:hypothetical protein
MPKSITKSDIILIIVIIAAAALFASSRFAVFGDWDAEEEGGSGSPVLMVTQDGGAPKYYPLNIDKEVVLKRGEARNILKISGGEAVMKEANCRGEDCLHEPPISKPGETIVCLPNKVIARVLYTDTSEGKDTDAITK